MFSLYLSTPENTKSIPKVIVFCLVVEEDTVNCPEHTGARLNLGKVDGKVEGIDYREDYWEIRSPSMLAYTLG